MEGILKKGEKVSDRYIAEKFEKWLRTRGKATWLNLSVLFSGMQGKEPGPETLHSVGLSTDSRPSLEILLMAAHRVGGVDMVEKVISGMRNA